MSNALLTLMVWLSIGCSLAIILACWITIMHERLRLRRLRQQGFLPPRERREAAPRIRRRF